MSITNILKQQKPSRKEIKRSEAIKRAQPFQDRKNKAEIERRRNNSLRQLGLEKRIEKSRERSAERWAVRGYIAKKEGVNIRRVVLTGKIVEGQEVPYVIKKAKPQKNACH